MITSIIWYFAVYCILRGKSETIQEIAYEVQNLKNEVLLLPLNNVPIKTNERAKYDKFVLIEGSEARIAVYGESIYKINGISVEVIPENWHLSTERVLSAKENSYVCYVKIHQIYSSMRREWEITFSFNGYSHISKTIAVHIRPSEVSNGPSVSVKPNKLITTQIASHAIKDFDAFGCLVYKDQDDLEMKCKQSTSNTILMEWSPSFEDKDSVKTNGKEAAIYSNRLKLIHNGNYTDCIEHMIRDTITVRIFLVLSTTKSWPNDNSVKPITSDDRDGCAKYVSCLYGSGVLKQNDYCVKPADTEPDAGSKIEFEIVWNQNQFSFLFINARHDNSTGRDTFTILEGEPAIINIYHNSTDMSVEKVTISEANTNTTIKTKKINEKIDSLYTLRIKNDYSKLSRIWNIQILSKVGMNYEKDLKHINNFQIHIRPNENGMPRVHTREKIIPIQRADSSFQDFDGFGCVFFDTYSSLDLYCKKSRKDSIGIHWITGPKTNSNDYCSNSDYCTVSLNLPETGNIHMDCIERLSEDITTVRIFFIHNNNDINIPSSEKDRAGCLNYVTRYNSPDDSNRESKTILSNNSRKRQKGGAQNTNINNSPPPQNRPTGNRPSHNNNRPGPPAQRPTSPRQPNTQHHKHNEPSPPKNSPSANNIFPRSTSPPAKSPSQFEHKHNTNGHRQFQNNNDDKPLVSPPPNTKTDINIKNKDVHSWSPKLSTTVNPQIANSILYTRTLFHDFNNRTAWPDLDPTIETAKESKNTFVAGTTEPKSGYNYIPILVSVLTILVVILILTILYMKFNNKEYWTANKPIESRYANDRQPLRQNVEKNIYVDSDSGTVQYINNIPDIYAKPIPKSERNVQVNNGRAETNVLVDSSVYEGSDIYAEPNYSAFGNQSNTGTPCNEEYSYAYADPVCIRPLVNNTCDKNYDYATINEEGQDTYAEVKKNASYSNINTNNRNGVSKDYVNAPSYLY